jgi:hypothetical protein
MLTLETLQNFITTSDTILRYRSQNQKRFYCGDDWNMSIEQHYLTKENFLEICQETILS